MPTIKNEEGEEIPKPSREWNELEKIKAFLIPKPQMLYFVP